MDSRNRVDAIALAPDEVAARKVSLLLDHVGGGEIPDPIAGTWKDFVRVHQTIEQACGALLPEIALRLSGGSARADGLAS
jgi:protein-tyrosine-phosphatase